MVSQWKRYLDKKIRYVGIVDIETGGNGFNANNSWLITWVIKIIDLKTTKSKVFSARINKKTIQYWDKQIFKHKKLRATKPYDTKLLEGLVKQMKKCDMIVGHYSDYFDVPLIRTRCMILKLPFLEYTDHIRFGDTWKKARFGMKFIRNTLDIVGKSLGIDLSKTSFDVWVWNQATYHGKKWAIDLIMDHNKKDVEITFKIWKYTEINFNIPAKYH